MTYYVEIHESRRFTCELEAMSEVEAERLASLYAQAGELPSETLDREVLAVPVEIEACL
jgi:hypothetical protein